MCQMLTNLFQFYFPEFYYHAEITAEAYQKELEYQLRKTTLGISVGLVKEVNKQVHFGESNVSNVRSRFFNPFSHFARDAKEDRNDRNHDLNYGPKDESPEEDIHEYKICEIRPPSIEKVKKTFITL